MSQDRFPTTNWSLIGRAGNPGDQFQREALDALLRRYWPALRAYLVYRRRLDANDAEDVLQGFINDKILERNLVGRAERNRGRFRSLLLTALDNYARNRHQRLSARKRTSDRIHSIDGSEEPEEAAPTPGEAFEVEWARQVLREATARMRDACHETDRESLWLVLEARVLQPIFERIQPLDYAELAARLGFEAASQAANALVTAKRMLARYVRETIAEYAFDGADIEAELVDLRNALSRF